MEPETSQQEKPTHDQILQSGRELFEKLDGITGGYFANAERSSFYQLNTLRYNMGADMYFAEGLEVRISETETDRMYDVKEGSTVYDDVVAISKEEFDSKFEFVSGKFSESFNDVSRKGYLFKFDDSEGRKFDQLIPYIIGASRGEFAIHFYYAPNPSCFRLVHILPEDIVIESTMPHGEYRLVSFAYRENQMTIEGNPFSSSTRDMRLYKFRNTERINTGPITEQIRRVGFDKDAIYLISEWHYKQILDIIMSETKEIKPI